MKYFTNHIIYKFTFYLLFLCLVCNPATSQEKIVHDIKDQLDQYRQKTLQEKLFVHTDRNFYLAGEIIWFKLYDVDASFHKPLGLSKVAYVELLDADNKPLLQAKIAMKNGSGNGSFYLPANARSGNCKLRAYTNWMKNYSVDYFFEKAIAIVNSQKINTTPVLTKQDHVVRFFPEGGNLVNNIKTKIAFKVVNQDGRGVACTGIIADEKNETIVKFQTLKFGMGSFYFTPSLSHTYKAVFTLASGQNIESALPAIEKEGYVMNVSDAANGRLRIDIQTNVPGDNKVYVVVHSRGLAKGVDTGTVQNGHSIYMPDKNDLADGISHITVFNKNSQPVCERLYFTYPKQQLQVDASLPAPEFGNRKKVQIKIQTSDEHAQKKAADLSMSVYRLDSLQVADDIDISSYLLLSSELRGTIESPSWYFTHPAKETEEAMHNLMLTQGWRRFRWKDVLENAAPVLSFAPEYHGHIVTGKIIDTRTGAASKNIEGFMSVPSVRTQFNVSTSDVNGLVKFDMKNMTGSTEVIVQTNPLFDSAYRIDVQNPFSENYADNKLPAFVFPQNYPNTILDESINMQAQNIYAGEKLKEVRLPVVDTNAFYQNPDAIYWLDNYKRFTTMEEVMREYVTATNVKLRNGKFTINLQDKMGNKWFDDNPLVLLDGVPVFDINKIMQYDPLKISRLEVVNNRYFIGNSVFNGILNWTTYKGDLKGFELDPHATVIDYEGLQLQREFYAPSYDDDKKLNSHVPDLRNTLYWSPSIHTDQEGKQTVNFYTSDARGKYLVVLQGISADGKFGSRTIQLEVK